MKTEICNDLNEFRKMSLEDKFNDVIQHYARGFDGFYVEKINMAKTELSDMTKDLEDCKGIIKRTHQLKYPDATDYTIRLELQNQRYSQEINRLRAKESL